jgi:hypothetical protein
MFSARTNIAVVATKPIFVGHEMILKQRPLTIAVFDKGLLRSQTMNRETDKIAVGTRFKISKLGAVRCPNLADKIGIVVGLSRHNTDLLAQGLYIFNI